MKPFCIATIGSFIGIIMGLYLKSIALFVLIFILMISILFNKKLIIVFIFAVLFFGYICIIEKNYDNVIEKYENKDVMVIAEVISNGEIKEYKTTYKIKITKINSQKVNIKILLNIKENSLKYGDIITFKAILETPNTARNEGGFDYRNYLKTKNIVFIADSKMEEIEILKQKKSVSKLINNIKEHLIQNIEKLLDKQTSGLCIGLLLGEKSTLDDDIEESFRNSNLSHMLAISGAHISYILLGVESFFIYTKMHKRWGKIVLIIFLLFFTALVGFTPSVTRAVIMSILNLMSSLLYRKSDIYQNLAISSLLILIFNPYTLYDIGFQLSFGGTLGIVLFAKKFKKEENKIIDKIKQMAIVSISANIVIIPIMAYHFNTISATFIISNILASPILGIAIIMGFMLLIVCIIFNPLAVVLSFFYQPILKILVLIADISAQMPFSQILIPTPKIWQIILYYLIVIIKANLNGNFLKNYINKFKDVIILLIIIVIISPYFIELIPNNELKIHFIDVGQGDSTLIITTNKKKILIDGGGSESFDTGEKVLLPYLLNKNITTIDYMIISHFDTDHCKGLFTILNKLKVKNVIISKQGEVSENLQEFVQILNTKKTNLITVKQGDIINFDDTSKMEILFPEKAFITQNILNNNSIVSKFIYKDEVSMLFTGDIEEIAEKRLIEKYKEKLKANILKLAHHGSKTSSIKEFLKYVKPQIALIGVGENNTFGHPNEGVITRLEKIR